MNIHNPCDGLALSRGYLLSRLLAIVVQSYSTGPRLIERVVFSLTGFIMTVQVNKWNIIYLNCWERLRHNRWAPGHNWSSQLHTKWKQLWNFYSWTGFEPITSAWCSSNLAIKPSVSWSTSLWVRHIPVDGGEHINHSLPSAQKYAKIFVRGHYFRDRSSRKTVIFEEQTMSKDKYPRNVSRQMMAIVCIILQNFLATHAVLKIGEY